MNYSVDTEAKRIDFFDQRWYEINTEKEKVSLRSVTTFLEAYPDNYNLIQWFKSNGFNSDIILERSQIFGSKFHEMIEKLLKGETIEWHEGMDIELWERLMLWYNFWIELNENHKVNYDKDFVEFITYELDEGYAGTVDLLCRIDGDLVLIDWKTSNYIQAKWDLQTSAYAKATSKLLGQEIYKSWVVWFPAKKPNKKGYRIIENSDIELNYTKFLDVKKVYLLEKGNETPKYKSYPTQLKLGK